MARWRVTGAIYRQQEQERADAGCQSIPTQFVQLGERKVKGIELGIVGKLTDAWEISAGVAKMDTEVKRGLANQNGLQITWSPELTFTSWTTYHTPFGLTIGGGFRYVDSVIRPVSTNGAAAAAEPDQHAHGARLLGDGRHGSATRSTSKYRCSSTPTT